MYICIEYASTYICIEYASMYICIEYASTYICIEYASTYIPYSLKIWRDKNLPNFKFGDFTSSNCTPREGGTSAHLHAGKSRTIFLCHKLV